MITDEKLKEIARTITRDLIDAGIAAQKAGSFILALPGKPAQSIYDAYGEVVENLLKSTIEKAKHAVTEPHFVDGVPLKEFNIVWEQVEPFVHLGENEVKAPNLYGALLMALQHHGDYPEADSVSIDSLGED